MRAWPGSRISTSTGAGRAGPERYRLVATVSPQDLGLEFRYFGFGIANPEPITQRRPPHPDGTHLAFVSTASLTGYDNTDAADGRPAQEVFSIRRRVR